MFGRYYWIHLRNIHQNLRNIWDYIIHLFIVNIWLEAFSYYNQSSGVNHNIRPINGPANYSGLERVYLRYQNRAPTAYFVFLFDLIIYVPSTIFHLCRVGLPTSRLNQYQARIHVSCSRTQRSDRWGSSPRPLGLESSNLPLSHCSPVKQLVECVVNTHCSKYLKEHCIFCHWPQYKCTHSLTHSDSWVNQATHVCPVISLVTYQGRCFACW